MSIDRCKIIYSLKDTDIVSTQLCAGGQRGVDSCRGDSGGPLMAITTQRGQKISYLAGITSFGTTTCGDEGWPGVYTHVGSFVDWITEKMHSE